MYSVYEVRLASLLSFGEAADTSSIQNSFYITSFPPQSSIVFVPFVCCLPLHVAFILRFVPSD
jgi:hypothetical protein